MSTLQPRPNINRLLRFSTMYQHQIYIGTNVTPVFLFYIKCPEAFASLWSKWICLYLFQHLLFQEMPKHSAEFFWKHLQLSAWHSYLNWLLWQAGSRGELIVFQAQSFSNKVWEFKDERFSFLTPHLRQPWYMFYTILQQSIIEFSYSCHKN